MSQESRRPAAEGTESERLGALSRPRGRMLGDAEIARILQTAADLQERSDAFASTSGLGLTIEDLRQWADTLSWPGTHVHSVRLGVADGSPLARVTLPSNSRIAAVRDSRVALVVRDSLDVEHVRILALRPGGRRAIRELLPRRLSARCGLETGSRVSSARRARFSNGGTPWRVRSVTPAGALAGRASRIPVRRAKARPSNGRQ